VDAIKTQLDQILQRLKDMDERAADLNLSVVMDQSTYVRGSLRSLQIEAGLGAVMAGLVVLVFLRSVRAKLIAVVALPFSLLAAFIGMYLTCDTLNGMSLGGLRRAPVWPQTPTGTPQGTVVAATTGPVFGFRWGRQGVEDAA